MRSRRRGHRFDSLQLGDEVVEALSSRRAGSARQQQGEEPEAGTWLTHAPSIAPAIVKRTGLLPTRYRSRSLSGEAVMSQFAADLPVSDRTPYTDPAVVHDDETARDVLLGNLGEEAVQRLFCLLDRGGPHSKANHTLVRSHREHPGIREVLVERDDNRRVRLGPFHDLFVATP